MDFKKLTVNDTEMLNKYFGLKNYRLCDYSAGTVILWRDFYNAEYALENEVLYLRYFENNVYYYALPITENIADGINKIKQYENGNTVTLCTVPESETENIKRLYPGCKLSYQPEYSDYLYNLSDLAFFKGKKYHGQRNLVKQFLRNGNNFEYLPIKKENINEIFGFLKYYYSISPADDINEETEKSTVYEALNNLETYKFSGYMLKLNGKVIGFSLGETVGDTLFVHIEKADRNIKGAYQMTVSLFAKQFLNTEVKYINREEDMGDEGLKISKLSYHPIALLKKYNIEIN